MWPTPIYQFMKYDDPTGVELWVCSVELPQIGPPLLTVPRRIGPFSTRACFSDQQAHVEAAEIGLQTLKVCSLMK